MIDFRRGKARYVPLARLAVGGMAEVWRGEARFADGEVRPVAIKRVLPKLAKDPVYRGMFEDEARLGMLLRHPNIVRVFDAREVQGTYIMIMELVRGPSLRSVLARAQQRRAPMPVPCAAHIARELCRALHYAHDSIDEWGRSLNIVHRDVSPHNVLLSEDGAVKLMDFGLANASANVTARDGMVGGKLAYLAPEVITEHRIGPALDLFAVGVVLWECLTGRRLFAGEDDEQTVRNVLAGHVPPASRYNPRVPGALDALLARALEPDPSRRVGSALELGRALHRFIQSLPGDVGARDVSLMVRLYQRSATREPRSGHSRTPSMSASSATIADMLEQELRAFRGREGGASGGPSAPLAVDADGAVYEVR